MVSIKALLTAYDSAAVRAVHSDIALFACAVFAWQMEVAKYEPGRYLAILVLEVDAARTSIAADLALVLLPHSTKCGGASRGERLKHSVRLHYL